MNCKDQSIQKSIHANWINRVGNTEQVGIWFHPFVFLQVNVRESEVVVAEETKKWMASSVTMWK